MVDTGKSGNEPISKSDLPPWTINEAFITSHPELHHYTNGSGLEGICKMNSLWATHFSNLSDTSEIIFLKERLVDALAEGFKPLIMKGHQEGSSELRDHITKKGGIEAAAHDFAGQALTKREIMNSHSRWFPGYRL